MAGLTRAQIADRKAAQAARAVLEGADAPAADAVAGVEDGPAPPVRFSAPCLIGGPIDGIEVGDEVTVTGAGANDGAYRVRRIDDGWLTVAPRRIEDAAPSLVAGLEVAA